MKKLLIFVAWVPSTFLLLLVSLTTYNSTRALAGVRDFNRLTNLTIKELAPKNAYQMYAALPQSVDTFRTAISKKDARPEIIRDYLADSPLVNYADQIIAMADYYNINPYLVVAIGECESNNGIKVPEGSYNAWGLGVFTGAKSGMDFANWEEGLNAEFKFLNKLMGQGLTTPDLMGPTYAPPSASNGGSWAKCVNHFLDNLK